MSAIMEAPGGVGNLQNFNFALSLIAVQGQLNSESFLKPGIMKNLKVWILVILGSFYSLSSAISQAIPQAKVPTELSPAINASFELEGYLDKRIDKSIQGFLLEIPESSPAILQVFRDRDRLPVRNPLMPWAGEFAGKYLTGAELVWRLTRDPALKKTIDVFVRDFISCQDSDGYLGPFPKDTRLTGENWDVWGHYHSMLGLMLYYEDTQYKPALEACEKIADLMIETFGSGQSSLTHDGQGGQMNMAICHGLVLLYEKTGQEKYLDFAELYRKSGLERARRRKIFGICT